MFASYMVSVGSIFIIVGGGTALFDMMGNGSRNAGWAPFGIAIAFIGIGMVWWVS